MTKEDAAHILREVAKSIEKEGLVLNEYYQKNPEYCKTYRTEIPKLMTQAIDTLTDQGKTSPESSGADQQ